MDITPVGESLPKIATARAAGPRICSPEDIDNWRNATREYPHKWFAIREFDLGLDQSLDKFKREYRKAQAQARAIRGWLNEITARDLSKFEQDSLPFETAGRMSQVEQDGIVSFKFTIYIRYMENRAVRRRTSA